MYKRLCFGVTGLGMRGIKKCQTIIYHLKKYSDTSILWYFVTSSVVNNFCKNPTVQIICSVHTDCLCHICYWYYVNFLPLDVVVMLLAFMLWSFNVCWWPAADLIYMQWFTQNGKNVWGWDELICTMMKAYWTSVPPDDIPQYLASPWYIIPSLSIQRYFSDTGISHIRTLVLVRGMVYHCPCIRMLAMNSLILFGS